MSAQLTLILPLPMARRTDPEVSHAAAAKAASVAPSHRNRIMAALDQGPATVREIAQRSGLSEYQVSKRMIECNRLVLAVPTGERDGMRIWAKL